jgi:hypothetical protein
MNEGHRRGPHVAGPRWFEGAGAGIEGAGEGIADEKSI